MTDPEAALRSYEVRPRSAGELVDAALAVLRSDLRAVGLFVVLPYLAVIAILGLVPRTSNLALSSLRLAVTFCLLAVPSFALQTLWAQRLLGRRPSLRSAALDAVAPAPSAMLATLASGLLLTVGYALLVVPGVYVMMALLLPSPVLVFERGHAWRSLARSRTLMHGSKLRLFLPFVVFVLLSTAASLVPLGSYARWPRVVISSLIMGYFSALAFVTYVDVRCRKEAFDIEVLAARVEARTRPPD